ncbi:hypothetical protein B296_00024593 [Ensete ventricosum]|uniref:Uncharacterized protein n=1 Tax=Ensete ventricosum TaxID=4639 RepID=A0A427AUL1_ENSVE|nr:hypothetical protein B296_00024593 [Ensete ventricosum]
MQGEGTSSPKTPCGEKKSPREASTRSLRTPQSPLREKKRRFLLPAIVEDFPREASRTPRTRIVIGRAVPDL